VSDVKAALAKNGLVPADLGGSRPLGGEPESIDWDEYHPVNDGERVLLGDPIRFDRA
jgi:hypothetical protein